MDIQSNLYHDTAWRRVDAGEYASAGEVICGALRDRSLKRLLMLDELAVPKQDIDKGLAGIVRLAAPANLMLSTSSSCGENC